MTHNKEENLIEILKSDNEQLVNDLNTLTELIKILKYHVWHEDFNEWFDPIENRLNYVMKTKGV